MVHIYLNNTAGNIFVDKVNLKMYDLCRRQGCLITAGQISEGGSAESCDGGKKNGFLHN